MEDSEQTRIWRGINMLSLGSFKAGAILLDGNGGEHAAAALPEDHEGCPEDGYGGEEDAAAPLDDHGYGGEEDAASPLEDDGCEQDGRGAASEDSDDDIVPFGQWALQLLAIRANVHVCAINAYDCEMGRCIYRQHEGEMEVQQMELQEQGMVDLVPIGPRALLSACGGVTLEVFHYITIDGNTTPTHYPGRVDLDFCDPDELEPEEYTESIFCTGHGIKLEITYLVIPNAIETEVEVKLKLKDLDSRSRAVYGKIKASTADYGNKSVHLFSCERGRSWSVPSGPTSILPLSPAVIALPYRRQLELHVEVDLIVITILDNQEEHKNLKFSLTFTRGIRSQEREVDDDRVEVSIAFDPEI